LHSIGPVPLRRHGQVRGIPAGPGGLPRLHRRLALVGLVRWSGDSLV